MSLSQIVEERVKLRCTLLPGFGAVLEDDDRVSRDVFVVCDVSGDIFKPFCIVFVYLLKMDRAVCCRRFELVVYGTRVCQVPDEFWVWIFG